MMGVVLWSDVEDRKAVFWCEDHGDLAYYDATSSDDENQEFMNAGDMVQFDITFERRMRRAHNAQMIEQKVCHGLQDQLRLNAGTKDTSESIERPGGEVLQFHSAAANAPLKRQVRNG